MLSFCCQFILKGIDKGDILSSGAPQITKDGSGGVNAVDSQSRRTKFGTQNAIYQYFPYVRVSLLYDQYGFLSRE